MPTIPSIIRYRKVVNWGLTPQAINFAQSSFMGHRVCFNVPVDFMNEYFTWTRYSRELRPTGRFVNDISQVIANAPTFQTLIERCLGAEYSDIDGVAQGLNYSSDALDTVEDVKRDICVNNYIWDYTPLVANPPSAPISTLTTTHYGANDFVMAFVLNKCFGSSSFDAYEIVYNLEDGFGMLTSAQLAAVITESLQEEEDKATAQVLPIKEVDNQNPGDDKGQVDAMFRSLLSMDTQRFYKQGYQIQGLFETNYICSSAVFTGRITTDPADSSATEFNTLIVTSVTSGRLSLGNVLMGTGVASNIFITAMAPGTTGGVGTYTLSVDNGSSVGTASAPASMSIEQDVQGFEGNISLRASEYVLVVTETLNGIAEIANGSFINGFGLPRGTTVIQITPPTTVPPTPVTEYTLHFPPGFNPNLTQLSESHYFTTPTPDPDAAGNWCLGVGDKIEIPVRFYFRAPVTVLSVIDNAKNPSSSTPDQVETVFIKGEGVTFDSTNADHVAAADKANMMAIRLQLLCVAPALAPPTTRSSSEDVSVAIGLQVVHKVSLVFYKGAHYPNQQSIAIVVVGGVDDYTYSFTPGGTIDQATLIMSNSPPGIDIHPDTGILSFEPTGANAVTGRWKVNVTITDGVSSINTDIYITVDGPAVPVVPGIITNPTPIPANPNISLTTLSGTNNYSITGYTINSIVGESITLNPATPNPLEGSWSVTATVGGATNIVPVGIGYNTSISVNNITTTCDLFLTANDPLYPPGSVVTFTAIRTLGSGTGTTTIEITIPSPVTLTFTPSTNIVVDSDGKYIIGNTSTESYYIDVTPTPSVIGATVVLGNTTSDINLTNGNRINLTNSNWSIGSGVGDSDTNLTISIEYKDNSDMTLLANIIYKTFIFRDA